MPPGATLEEPAERENVRVCAECDRAKSIRGVWYLVPGRAGSPFVCETCYASASKARAAI